MSSTFHPEILECEKVWITLQPDFEGRGYQFRPRFHPGWTPSWSDAATCLSCEDSTPLESAYVMDAVRVGDGARVAIKMISLSAHPEEARLTEILGTEPDSPIVPVLDRLTLPARPDLVFLVLKALVPWEARGFRRLDEALDFVKQMLSGLAFLHAYNISHGDISSSNIMMDGLHLFEHEPHPAMLWRQRADYASSTRVRDTVPEFPKFYFIDCGLSLFHRPPKRLVIAGAYGQDKTVPEFRTSKWNDPFKVDLWSMGRLLLVYVVDAYKLDLLRPLVEALRQVDPKARIPAHYALQFLAQIVEPLSPEELAAPIWLDTQYSIHNTLFAELMAVIEMNDRETVQPS